jgi:hypothetical protein
MDAPASFKLRPAVLTSPGLRDGLGGGAGLDTTGFLWQQLDTHGISIFDHNSIPPTKARRVSEGSICLHADLAPFVLLGVSSSPRLIDQFPSSLGP